MPAVRVAPEVEKLVADAGHNLEVAGTSKVALDHRHSVQKSRTYAKGHRPAPWQARRKVVVAPVVSQTAGRPGHYQLKITLLPGLALNQGRDAGHA